MDNQNNQFNLVIGTGISKQGKPYLYLGVNLDYCVKPLSWSRVDIAEILGKPVRSLASDYPIVDGEHVLYTVGVCSFAD